MKLERILVPVDFSSCSLEAAEAAAALAGPHGARIVLLYIPELPGPIKADALIQPTPGAEPIPLIDFYTLRAEEKFKPYRAALGDHLEATRVVPGKKPADLILQIAEELGVDMIVMGTHGRQGMQRLLMGSVTEAVIRGTARPVLVIRGSEPA